MTHSDGGSWRSRLFVPASRASESSFKLDVFRDHSVAGAEPAG
jgi:hypothetical protein